MRIILPLVIGVMMVTGWWLWVYLADIPPFLFPSPPAVIAALFDNFDSLMRALGVTLQITFFGFFWSFIGGVGLAILLTRARPIELAFYPYFVTLQVTPVVAVAPLILIWVGFDNVLRALIIITWIISFFPMLANSIEGLRSVKPDLHDMMTMARANWWQRLYYLELPAALPSILTGMKISGGLALIGAVMAEFVAGSGNTGGLAWRIIESGNRLEIGKMFACLLLLSLLGTVIFYLFGFIEWLILRRWHPRFN